MNLMPILLKDGYKIDHKRQYPVGSEEVYSNLTPRASRDARFTHVVNFGAQAFVDEYLARRYNEDFFHLHRDVAIRTYKRRIDNYLGKDAVPVDHIGELHEHGRLPLEVKALPEGLFVPVGVPLLTFRNTDPRFYWLTNATETLASCELWKPITNATIAFAYRRLFEGFARQTNAEMLGFVPWQGHDFSMRGMDGVESAQRSGAAHLLSFFGTDTVPAIDWLERYYDANSDAELIGGSVAATEHSVMCMGGLEDEMGTFNRLLELYPTGIVSVVSDTWDYWNVLTTYLPQLKAKIMARDGKLVVRPDSGDPFKIVCGDSDAAPGTPEWKGSLQVLWETFGGTNTAEGFRQLDPHIGLIYGDSITYDLARKILDRMRTQKFASTNIVLGIGSFTYQYNTRDTFGMAIKATHGRISGKDCELFKAPKTDSGLKKSARGYLRVNADLTLSQCVSREEESQGLLRTIFKDGVLQNRESLAQIRARLLAQLNGLT